MPAKAGIQKFDTNRSIQSLTSISQNSPPLTEGQGEDGLHVEAGDALHCLELLNLLDGDLDAFFGLFVLAYATHSPHDLIGNVHAGNTGLHDTWPYRRSSWG